MNEVEALKYAARLTIAAGLTMALTFGSCAPAFADTIAQKQAQAAAAEAKVAKLGDQTEIASEQYNAASATYDQLTAKERHLRSRISTLAGKQKKLQAKLDSRMGSMYRQGPVGMLSLLLDAPTLESFVSLMHAMTEQSRKDTATVAQLKASKAEAVSVHNDLVAARTQAAASKAEMAHHAATVKAQLAAQSKVLAGLNADVKRLIAEKKAREEAIARAKARAALARARAERAAAARARSHGGSASGGGHFGGGGNPPASGRGAKAVYWAERQLGKPYRWAASGPNSFDCSGLTMWAYRKVGVSLPHYSRAQINAGSRVSRANLQPGDLVFFGSPIHHVAMYVGGGDMIEAPYTGANVRISSFSRRGDFAGACRP
jgi:cell wall-associated NlpC family hydrolase